MAGTRRAADVCAGCGHARIRHNNRGRDACHVLDWITTTGPDGRPETNPSACPCPTFTEKESTR